MNIRIVILLLAIFVTSCSTTPTPTDLRNQKSFDLTKNLQESLRNLRCKNPNGWREAKEKTIRLIWNLQDDDSHSLQAQRFLAELKALERATDIKTCQPLVDQLNSDIADFANTLPHPHNNIHDRAPLEKRIINPLRRK